MTEPEAIRVVDPPDDPGEGGGVTAHWYRPKQASPRSAVGIVVLPIQGGDYEVSTHFAQAFSAMGFHALRFERRAEWLVAERPLPALAELLRRYRQDVREGITQWLARPDSPARIGLFGVSMGAGVGAAVAGVDPRIEASVLCLGGSGLARVLMETPDTDIRAYRDALAAHLGQDLPTLSRTLHAAIDGLDPEHDARGMDPRTTLFVTARFDRVVRWREAMALHRAIGRPRRLILPCGHYSAVAFVPLIRWQARRWFDRHLV
jgi:alpha-beta hydrolase superfamily lysophospholipase